MYFMVSVVAGLLQFGFAARAHKVVENLNPQVRTKTPLILPVTTALIAVVSEICASLFVISSSLI
jgi:hypothetical protein